MADDDNVDEMDDDNDTDVATRTITFWKNGFTLDVNGNDSDDDSEIVLHDYSDPASQQLLEQLLLIAAQFLKKVSI